MTESDPQERLDQLLRQWSERGTPSDHHLDRLTSRIVQSLDETPSASDKTSTIKRRAGEWSSGLRLWTTPWLTVGVAAGLILMVGYVWHVHRTGNGVVTITTSESPPTYALLPDRQLRDKAVLLSEMDLVFDRRLSWLAEIDNNVQVGVTDYSTRDAPTLALRVVVERRELGQTDWSPMWSVDVVARSEETVWLRPKLAGDAEMIMWAYALPDGMIVVDTDLQLTGLTVANSATSCLQENGIPVELYSTKTDSHEFRVFQTAALLERVI